MPSVYLESSDYTTYGIPVGTDSSLIIRASATINDYLKKEEGVIWVPDANGNPCYMQNLDPKFALTVTSGAITPGNNINITVSGAVNALQVGKAVVLDRANDAARETVVVTQILADPVTNLPNIVTLASVQFAHDANALLEFDLVIVEEQDMPYGCYETTLRKTPIANIVTAQGQFGYARRGKRYNYDMSELSLLPLLAQFGGAPLWQSFALQPNSWDANTGRVWVNPSIYLACYTQIRAYYLSGWTYASLPSQIKVACANIVNSILSIPITGNFKMIKQGDTTVEKFGNTLIDGDTQKMLNPFRAHDYV